MSLIKQHLIAQQRQEEALQEAKLQYLEYVMFGGLSPVKELEKLTDSLSKPFH